MACCTSIVSPVRISSRSLCSTSPRSRPPWMTGCSASGCCSSTASIPAKTENSVIDSVITCSCRLGCRHVGFLSPATIILASARHVSKLWRFAAEAVGADADLTDTEVSNFGSEAMSKVSRLSQSSFDRSFWSGRRRRSRARVKVTYHSRTRSRRSSSASACFTVS